MKCPLITFLLCIFYHIPLHTVSHEANPLLQCASAVAHRSSALPLITESPCRAIAVMKGAVLPHEQITEVLIKVQLI